MNNIQDKTKKYCTGCGACLYVCPVSAINYKLNENGFYEAFVDEQKCINCGKCKKVCSKFLEVKGESIREGNLIAARTKDQKTIKTTTSGGIAYEIAKYGIENGYKIFGTIYDCNKNLARAVIVDNMKELDNIKGSKYIQSKTDEAIKELLEDCKKSKENKYMIFGTPCQIAGVSNLLELQKVDNEIIKIDLFCHGVPSYIIWNKYLKQMKEKFKMTSLKECRFRSKYYGWHQYCIELVDNEEKKIYLHDGKSEFYKLFFNNILLNKSCYDCIFREDRTYADIRLGDYWGKKYYNDQAGVSAVLINTKIGEKIVNDISNNIEIIDNGELGEFLNNQSTEKYSNADFNLNFWRNGDIKHKSIKEIMKEYKKKLNYTEKIKVYVKNVMGKISPKCKYNVKKIYYNLKK